MRIRTIHPDELAAFAAVSTRPEDVETIQDYLNRLLTQGSTHYNWCFVVEGNTRPLGRVVYWTLPSSATPSDVVLLDVPWEENGLPIGTYLLRETAQLMRRHGATDISYAVDALARTPQWQHVPEQCHTLLTA